MTEHTVSFHWSGFKNSFPHLKVQSNLVYGMKGGLSHPPALFAEVVDLLGIRPLLDRRPSRLSGGEKQRVAIGRALLSNPELLLMDEPFASLDVSRREEILPFVFLMCKKFGIPVLYVSHSYGEIQKIADTLVVMENGSGRHDTL